MSKLASIQLISDIKPIPGADNIEVATVLGWECVVQKGEYKVGDRCIYIQIDTVVPPVPRFEFMRARKYRVRTIKLRGQLSQGLVIPATGLNSIPVGYDMTDALNIKKYEKPDNNPAESLPKRPKTGLDKFIYDFKYSILYRWFPKLRPKSRSPFPTDLVSITDEERIQNCPEVLDKFKGQYFTASYKLDGSSITIIHEKTWWGKSRYRICSRRFELHNTNNDWYKVFKSTNFKQHIEKLVKHYHTNNIIVQGEAIGPQFNGNHHRLAEPEIRLFNIFVDGKRIEQYRMTGLCKEFEIPHCPRLQFEPLNFTLPEILEFAKRPDIINPAVPAEGLVFRHELSNLSFKVINNDYLLHEN